MKIRSWMLVVRCVLGKPLAVRGKEGDDDISSRFTSLLFGGDEFVGIRPWSMDGTSSTVTELGSTPEWTISLRGTETHGTTTQHC